MDVSARLQCETEESKVPDCLKRGFVLTCDAIFRGTYVYDGALNNAIRYKLTTNDYMWILKLKTQDVGSVWVFAENRRMLEIRHCYKFTRGIALHHNRPKQNSGEDCAKH